MANFLRIARRLPGYQHRRGQWAPFLYRERLDALLDHYLVCLSRQDLAFSLLGPVDDHFHATVARLVPIIPSFVCLLLLFLLHISTPMKKLIFWRMDHWVASHCTCVRRIRRGEGNRRSYWWWRAIEYLSEPSPCMSLMRLFVQFPQTTPIVGTWFV